MKKIFMALMLCLVSIVAFGQISVSNQGSTRRSDESYFYKCTYGSIKKIDSTYVICVNDSRSNDALYVVIGSTADEAVESLTVLNSSFASLKNNEYITFNDGTKDVVLYKWSGVPYFSNGTPEYVHNYLKNATVQGLIGGNSLSSRIRENDRLIGCLCGASAFNKAIKKIKQ